MQPAQQFGAVCSWVLFICVRLSWLMHYYVYVLLSGAPGCNVGQWHPQIRIYVRYRFFFLLHFLWTKVSENTMEYLLVSNFKEMVINDAGEVIMSSVVLNLTDSRTASVMMTLMGTLWLEEASTYQASLDILVLPNTIGLELKRYQIFLSFMI